MYFVLPRWNDMKIVSTQDLQQNEVIKKFLFRLIHNAASYKLSSDLIGPCAINLT